ncbi:FecR family protein [Rhizobium sp. GR12]|uniref:FecR family protein n=1 Tax=Rhizobium sp. GR12 TaxID=3053925 RepID=UPI002FBEAC36
MPLDDDFKRGSSLMQEAAEWIAILTSGDATPDDAERLQAWRRMSPSHEQAFVDAARLWKTMGPALTGKHPQGMGLSRRIFIGGGAIAASAVGTAFVGSFLGITPSYSALAADFATARGEQKTVVLADGSTVEMDGGSILSWDFTSHTRALTLGDGAAVFNVVPDPQRAFRLTAENGITTAHAANFAVGHGSDEISVDCLEGQIEVECRGKMLLKAGQSVRYFDTGLGDMDQDEPQNMATWRRGLLVFRDKPLASVVMDINRHRRGNVVIGGSTLGQRRVSGVFHLSRPDEIITQLEATLNLSATRLPAGIVILR